MNLSRLSVVLSVLLFSGCLFEEDVTVDDMDGDGVPDLNDHFPENSLEWQDSDLDGIGDNGDEDDDNDGYNDTIEVELRTDPLDNLSTPPDNDRDFLPDIWDPDDDNDNILDVDEADGDFGNYRYDHDNDGIWDLSDTDDDNDGLSDWFEINDGNDLTGQFDSDNDGIENQLDDDDDDDGILDSLEN